MRGSLRVEGFAALTARVDELGDRARRPEPALRSRHTLVDLREGEQRRFRRGIRRASKGWLIEKSRRGLQTRPMVAHGDAEQALTMGAGPGASAIVFSAHNGELRWGVRRGRSDLYYVQVHASGYQSSSGKVTPRRAVVIDKDAREGIAVRVMVYVNSGKVLA